MKEPLLLLHGALESQLQFSQLIPLISEHYDIHTFDFLGHGTHAEVETFNMNTLAKQLKQYLKTARLSTVNILGYSMGGYVALYALPNLETPVNKVFTLATKWEWTDAFIENETSRLNPTLIEKKVPQLIVKLEREHPNCSWKAMLEKTATMMRQMKNYPINVDTLNKSDTIISIVRGSEDHMVSDVESQNLANRLAKGQYIELQDAPHLLHKIDASDIANLVIKHTVE